ncbi:DUF3137 domain-containing protein [Saprospiraceae bacterium]|nr:DUF3137 domain-containing protein [Saprospiraceae bacterium]MDB4539408.1 DUF3137 domain-containing protein [Saprospiraceae bacterium]MDB4768793.1 DUF3137 domain-containing protein [Saprospiraceae bacterium]
MRRIDEFRLFYNHTIQPELVRMERVRKRLLFLLTISAVVLVVFVIVLLFFQAAMLSFFLVLPLGFYLSYLLYRIQQFRLKFKPNVLNLILDFMDNGVNYGTLNYDSKRKVEKRRFIASQIFKTSAPQYSGEDYISGKIGELDFELSELNVREYSKVRSRLNYVFRGIFLYATMNQKKVGGFLETEMLGEVLILPKKFKPYLSKTIRSFNLKGGVMVDEETLQMINHYDKQTIIGRNGINREILAKEMVEHFLVYATEGTEIAKKLSSAMQHTILSFREKTENELYVSFIKNEIYIAITEPNDILEPYVFRSNVSFELIYEFYEDIDLLINMLKDFDNAN